MANINFGDLPKGIDFYNPNWAANYDVNSVFPGQGGSLMSVNDGHGHFLHLPTQFIQNQNDKYGNHGPAPGGGSFGNRLASLGSSSQAAPAPTVNGMSFADYLNQIGVHVPGSTGTPSTDPNNPVAQIMAGFSTPAAGGLGGFVGGLMNMAGRSRFAPRSHFNTQPPPLPGDIQNLMPYYQQFLHMNDTGGGAHFGIPGSNYGMGTNYGFQNPVSNQAPIPTQAQPMSGNLGDTLTGDNLAAAQAMFQNAGTAPSFVGHSSGGVVPRGLNMPFPQFQNNGSVLPYNANAGAATPYSSGMYQF